ncbi:MAG TPA: cysteine synthase family protein [Puia sp.]
MSDLSTIAIPGIPEKLAALQSQIGNTPLFEVRRLFQHKKVRLYAKQEWMQLSGSVKARAAYAIFRDAIGKGRLGPGKILLDATSGNTGIAYAWIGKALGIPVTLCLPENASAEIKEILKSLDVDLVLTSRFEGTDGAQEVALALAEKNPDRYFYADQYKNENNWKAHYSGTGPEIIESVPGITHFVAGLGTTGTFMGTGRRLKKYNPAIQLISLEPDNPLHGMEGWKHMETAVIPEIYDPLLADADIEVSTEEAYEMMKRAKEIEGLNLSPSSAANLAGAIRVASGLEKGIVVTVFPDNADKYADTIKKIFK